MVCCGSRGRVWKGMFGMNVLIVGCKKVGSRLASLLSAEGHTVSIVDKDPGSFTALDDDFDGYTVAGIPIDEDVLRRAGIESCDAMAAVTPDDNVNIMACQIAKELFHVPLVLTRMYDPAREEIFSNFGISTVCSTNLTVNAVKTALTECCEIRQQTFGSATMSYSTVPVPKSFVGRMLGQLEKDDEELLFGVTHTDRSFTLASKLDYELTAADKLIFVKRVD